MRHYATNSPQAIARLLALGMLIDGVAEEAEYEVLEQHDVLRRLGIDRSHLDGVIRDMYEDFDLGGGMGQTLGQRLTGADLSQLVAEVTDHALHPVLLRGMMLVAVANTQVSDGEARLVRAALMQWIDDASAGH